jgi:hypothetical protein
MLACSAGYASAQSADDERPPGEDGPRRPSASDAEDSGPQEPLSPARIRATLGAGATLRFIEDIDFGQSRFAPSFVELGGNYVFAGRGVYRHGVGLGVSLNLTGDGYANSSLGVNSVAQVTFAPNYTAYFRLSDDFVLTGHVGLGIATGAPSISLGTEVGVGLAYMLTAGLGLYVQATQNVWFGSEMTIHPTLSGEGGIVIDYEMLP